jgi:thiol-disulfide isomerase/thioredoxin
LIRSFLAVLICVGLVAPLMAETPTPPRPSPEFAIHLAPAPDVSPTQFKGKVVLLAFILTTCPHCQKATQMLSGLQNEYGPRGLQIMAAAFNEMSNMLVPDFNKQFRPTFPVGWAMRGDVLNYLEHSTMTQMYVPIFVMIDRKGIIRSIHYGDDPFMSDQEKNVRGAIEQLLNESSGAKKTQTSAVKKKTS